MKGCRPLTDEEITLVAKSFSGAYAARDKALFLLGCKSGFRISELLSLRIGDVSNGRVTVGKEHMKGQKRGRTVALHHEASTAVQAWLAELGEQLPSAYIFRSREGVNRPIARQRASAILQAAYQANELTGKVATHSMRKSFALKIYQASGKDIIATRDALGHRHASTTDSYLGARQDELDALVLAI